MLIVRQECSSAAGGSIFGHNKGTAKEIAAGKAEEHNAVYLVHAIHGEAPFCFRALPISVENDNTPLLFAVRSVYSRRKRGKTPK